MKRYRVLDGIRGITLCSMILYHAVWDLVYIFDYNWEWYRSELAYVWQQSICWCFILLSGFCFSLGKKKVRRGLIIFGAGALVSLVTHVVMPGQSVCFGVLTMLGSSMVLLALFELICKKAGLWTDEDYAFYMKNNAGIMMVLSVFIFFLTRGINEGYLGFEKLRLFELPDGLYRWGNFMTYIGFMNEDFFSTDYFSMMPWFFLFLTGYFLFHWMQGRDWLKILLVMPSLGMGFCVMGKHSLLIYLLHQPIVYAFLVIIDKI